MVIGNGLIAKALHEFENKEQVLIFASGVSNSSGALKEDFDREESLLFANRTVAKTLVYFSTCSVFDESLQETPYVIHKKHMEDLILQYFPSYCILRLPTLVGRTDNPFTFFNYFKNKLRGSSDIVVFKKASRYLFDVDALPGLIRLLVEKQNQTTVMNAAFDNKASVIDIVSYMKKKLNSDSALFYEDKGFDILIDNSDFINFLRINNAEDAINMQKHTDIIDKYIIY